MLSLTFNRSSRSPPPSLSCAWPTPRPNSCGNYLIIKPLNFCFPLYIYLWNYNFIFQHSCQSKPPLIRHRKSCHCRRFRASIVWRALTIHLWPGPLAYVVNSFFILSLCAAPPCWLVAAAVWHDVMVLVLPPSSCVASSSSSGSPRTCHNRFVYDFYEFFHFLFLVFFVSCFQCWFYKNTYYMQIAGFLLHTS